MRRFVDGSGRSWDVVAGRESWGVIVALFVPGAAPVSGASEEEDPGIRQATLDARGYAEATERLDTMTEEELRSLLRRARPKDEG